MADIQKVDRPDHPNRCQGIINNQGQCSNLAAEGSTFCLAHGGNKAAAAAKAKSLRNYQLDRWNAKLIRLGHNPDIKSLRDEIAILRMIMEEHLQSCKTETDLLLKSHTISELVMKIDKVVGSCHKLEGSMGKLLDKSAILQFASEVINAIGEVVTDESQIAEISDRILRLVGQE